jgi:hypothetical protein
MSKRGGGVNGEERESAASLQLNSGRGGGGNGEARDARMDGADLMDIDGRSRLA